MTDASPPALGAPAHAFDVEAQTLAQSLRSARLTVLVGALGVGKSTLLVDGVLPLLRRRVGDTPSQGGGPPQGATPTPDRRRGAQGELLHFVDRWGEPPDERPARTADEPQAAGRTRFELAEAMSPAHLADVSRRHGGARLLFVFDHFERLLEGVQHQPPLQRFADAWAEVVQAPDLGVHFLVAIDEPAWPRLQAAFAGLPAVDLRGYRLRAGADGQVLEPLRDARAADAAAGPETSDADLAASFNQSLSQLATLAREERRQQRDFAASVDADLSSAYSSAHAAEPPTSAEPIPIGQQTPVQSARSRLGDTAAPAAPGPDPVEPVRKRDAAAETERQADAWQRAEAHSAREAAARAAESRHAAQAVAEREAAARSAEAERVAQAQRAAEAATAAQAERNAEAARQAEAARRAELQRLEQSLAAAQAAAAREAQAREAAEAVAKAAEAQRLSEAQQRAEAERRAEAARQVEAAAASEAQRLAQSLTAAKAAAAREAQAREAAEAAASAAEAQRLAEAQQRAEAERRAEAAKQVAAAAAAEAQRLAQSRAAAETAAAREMQVRHADEAAAARQAAELAEAARALDAARASAQAQERVLEERASAAAEPAPPATDASEAAASAPLPDVAKTRPARTGLLWGAVLLLGATAALLWWPTTPTPPLVASAPMPMPMPIPTPEAGPASAAAPAATPASASAATPAAADAGRYSVLLATDDRRHARFARELAGALSTEGSATRVAPLPEATEPISGLQAPGRLAIVRYDALRAARANAAPPLRVLTPLYPEAVLFVVRADSPLKYVHELRGRRLSIGPVQSDGAHTVRAIYRHLFGTDMKASERLDNDAALAELVAFRSIDAMAIIEPLPSEWWASLDPGTARRLRLLTLDPRHPADRRLLQAPGASVARVGLGAAKGAPTTTPAVMSFLVASGESDADVERLNAMAQALCRELPRLRERGHPKWRELQPASRLDTGWPTVPSFRSAVSRCDGR